jgi:hypothetical protein
VPAALRPGAWMFAAAVLLALLLRGRALDMPLDRDLAAYATIGQHLFDGVLPYRDLFDHKQPLVYPLYALLDLAAPRSTIAIRVAAAICSAASGWLVWWILRRAGARRGAVAAGLATVVLAGGDPVEGLGLNTEHLLAVCAAAAVAVALGPPAATRAIAAGALAGLAFLSKAVGLAVIVPVLFAVAAGDIHRLHRAALVLGGFALVVLPVVAAFAAAGALGDLAFGNFTYNRLYLAEPAPGLRTAIRENLEPAALAAAAGALGGWMVSRRRDRLTTTLLLWLAGAVAGALLSTRGFPHYWAPVVAPACALIGLGLVQGPRAPAVVVGVLVAAPFAAGSVERLGETPRETSARVFGSEQSQVWAEAEDAGALIRRRAAPGDRLYAEGGDPNVYWQAGLRPAARYFTNLAVLVTPRRWRTRTEDDVCGAPPAFLVRIYDPVTPDAAPACLSRQRYVVIGRIGRTTVLRRSPAARRGT